MYEHLRTVFDHYSNITPATAKKFKKGNTFEPAGLNQFRDFDYNYFAWANRFTF